MTILADGAVHLGLSGGHAELLVVMGGEVTVSLVSHTAARTHRILATAMVDTVLSREGPNPLKMSIIAHWSLNINSLFRIK